MQPTENWDGCDGTELVQAPKPGRILIFFGGIPREVLYDTIRLFAWRSNRDYWLFGCAHDTLGDRPEQQPLNSFVTVGCHNDNINSEFIGYC
jgi:hypothetical protein